MSKDALGVEGSLWALAEREVSARMMKRVAVELPFMVGETRGESLQEKIFLL